MANMLRPLHGKDWSGGGVNLISNVKLAEEKYGEYFADDGLSVVFRNVVPGKLLFNDKFIYIPQNAWAWHGPTSGFCELRRRSLIRLCSEVAAKRAYRSIRIGPMIPKWSHSVTRLLPNVLDEHYETALADCMLLSTPSWMPEKPYVIVPGSMWSYRNIQRVVEAFCDYQNTGGELELLIVGPPGCLGSDEETVRYQRMMKRGIHIESNRVTRAEMLYAIRGSKICVLSSLVEASPVTALEAAALDVPVIAWDIPAYRYIAESSKLLNFHFANDVPSLVVALNRRYESTSSAISSPKYRIACRDWWIRQFIELACDTSVSA